MDELAGIRMFVRVVEGGSFVAAARRLGLSKSVITKRVRELEELLKAQLLVRSTRRLTLTDAGASYFERCVRIVAELDEAQSAVRSLTVGLTGTLRISCIASFLAHQLARDVCRFQQEHPDSQRPNLRSDPGGLRCLHSTCRCRRGRDRSPAGSAATAIAGGHAWLFHAARTAEPSERFGRAPLRAQQLHSAALRHHVHGPGRHRADSTGPANRVV